MHSFDAATGTLQVDATSETYVIAATYLGKIVATSTDTKDSYASREVEDEFTLHLEDACYRNELTLDSEEADFVYYVGVDGMVGITPDFTRSVQECSIVAIVSFRAEGSNSWVECDEDCESSSTDSSFPFFSLFDSAIATLNV